MYNNLCLLCFLLSKNFFATRRLPRNCWTDCASARDNGRRVRMAYHFELTHERRTNPIARGSNRKARLEEMGALSFRATVGNRSRGLQRIRRCVEYFSHDQARSRAYRWGEDGLAGISDDKAQLCFA